MTHRIRFIFLFNVVLLLSINGVSLFNVQPVSAANDTNFTQIEWADMGDGARYPLIGGLDEGQSIVLNNQMYLFSGYNPELTPTRKSFLFDPTKAQPWSPIADMPVGLTHMGLASDGKDIYLAGGYIENIPYNSNVPAPKSRIMGSEKFYRYNVMDNTYTSLPSLPKKASTGQLAYVNGKLHYMGGTTPLTGEEDYPDHFVFDLEAYAIYETDRNNTPIPEWEDITATAGLPNPRQHAGVAVIDNKIYYVSGEWGHGGGLVSQDDIHCFDPATNTWTEMEEIPRTQTEITQNSPAGRNHIGSTTLVHGGRIFVLGGQSASGIDHDTVFAFDPNGGDPDSDGKFGVWAILNPLPIKQFGGIAGVINGTFYFGTGVRAHDSLNARRRLWKGVPLVDPATATPTNTEIPPTATATNTEVPATATTAITPTNTAMPVTITPISGTATATSTVTLATMTATLNPTTATPELTETATLNASETPSISNNLLVNGSFEIDINGDKQPDGWTLKFGSKDQQKCNKPGKPAVAFDQQCAYVFKGGGDGVTPESAKLEYSVDLTTLAFAANDTLQLTLYVDNASAGINGQVKVVVKYGDLTPKSKLSIDLTTTSGYEIRTDSLLVTSASVSKIKVQVKHTAASGKTLLDAISLSKTAGSAGLLPLP